MEARSAWCALEGRIIRRVVPLVCSFVCFVSSILLSLSLFLSTGWVSTSSTERARKADRSPSNESSPTSTGPCKGSEGTALGQGPGSPGAGIAGASGAVFTSCPLSLCPSSLALLLIYD